MKKEEEDRKLAEDLFGSTGRIRTTGGHRIEFETILMPLEWDQAVIRAFCEDCGIYVELNEEIAKRYAYSADIKFPENPKEYYFHTKGCALCDSPNAEVKLVPLPNA